MELIIPKGPTILHVDEANIGHSHAFVHPLDTLEGGVEAGGFGEELHECIVSLINNG